MPSALKTLFGGGLLMLGGALVALGAGLAVFVLCAYVEWDAAARIVPTVLCLGAAPAAPGLVLILAGGAVHDAAGMRAARLALAAWMLAIGAALALGPLFNLIWAGLRGASFTAPGGPIWPYAISIAFGAIMVAAAQRVSPD